MAKSAVDSLYLEECQSLLGSYSANITTMISRFGADLRILSHTQNNIAETEKIVENLKTFEPAFSPSYLHVFYVEKSGRAYFSNGISFDFSDQECFKQIFNNHKDYYIDGISKSKLSGTRVFNIASAVYCNNEKTGFFCTSIPVFELTSKLSFSGDVQKGNLFVTDSNDQFLIRPSTEILNVFYEDQNETPGYVKELFTSIRENPYGHFSLKDNSKKEFIVQFNPVEGTDWTVGLAVPKKQFSKASAELKTRMLLVLIICAGLFCLVFAVWLVFIQYKQRVSYHKPAVPKIDRLTGLPAMEYFEKSASELLKDSDKKNYMFLAFDIQGLKFINQTYSAIIGNDILILFGLAFEKYAREQNGIVGRGSEDQFFGIVPVENKEKSIESFYTAFYENEALVKYDVMPILLKTGIVFTGYVFGKHSFDELVEKAVYARNYIKDSFNLKYKIFDDELCNKVMKEKKIEVLIPKAIKNREFEVYYQPKYSLVTSKIIGAEALVRWNSPELGILSPDEFMYIFEHNGTILKLDFLVYEKVFEFLHRLLQNGYEVVPVSVNMSRCHTQIGGFVKEFISLMEKYQIPPELIEVEILESTVVSADENLLNETVDVLHRNGLRVAMDDFGTGESSLNMLDSIPVDTLKIDKNFLLAEKDWDKTQNILLKIVELAKDLNKHVVCEGIETETQAEFLRSINCDCAQGFFYSKPVPEQKFQEIILTLQKN